ncbi:O-antigen ligase family protein [Microbacterium sp. NPDC057650]|uniref:O-antigen ligase family protein n=1 Tax=unclassified Microbacterium TaxID=2609290 RepID=UPI00366AB814
MTQSNAAFKPSLIAFLLAVMAAALNQSGVIAGVNLSIADPLVLICLLLLIIEQKVRIPPRALLFFSVVLATTTLTAVCLTPSRFGTIVDDSAIASDALKLATSFLYLIVGYSAAAHGLARTIVRWFAFGATTVALVGIVTSVAGIHQFDQALYYGGIRYRGLMNDPNYFSVLACAAIAYFVRDKRVNRVSRTLCVLVLVCSILLSGSKTGFIALLLLTAVLLFEYIWIQRRSGFLATMLVLACIVVALFWNDIAAAVFRLSASHGAQLPQLSRVAELFDDSLAATAQGGSNRDAVWSNALSVMESSPLLGVGIGSYTAVTAQVFGQAALAHNTYLQLASEWGMPLAVLFFGWLIVQIVRGTVVGYRAQSTDMLMLRDMLLVFAIGSFGLSLNNARMFWLFLGAMMLLLQQQTLVARWDAGETGGSVGRAGSRLSVAPPHKDTT